jgi:hypothetical protein
MCSALTHPAFVLRFLQLSDGIYVFANITGIKLNATVIGHLFRNFVQKVATPKVRASTCRHCHCGAAAVQNRYLHCDLMRPQWHCKSCQPAGTALSGIAMS